MGYRAVLPPVTLSTRTSRLVGVETYFQIARAAGIEGVDIDLTGRPRFPRAESIEAASRAFDVAVRSLWMPLAGRGPLARRRFAQSLALAASLIETTDLTTVTFDVPPPGPLAVPLAAVVEAAKTLRREIGPLVRVAAAIRARHLDPRPGHLARIAALRRAAEEWDFDVALDLLGPVERAWEAEAAVTRLLPRLTLIRLGPLGSRPPGRGRAEITARTLATLADGSFAGELAVTPSLPLWRDLWPPALTHACASMREQVRSRFLTWDEQPFYGFGGFGSSLESRPRW